MQSHTPDAIVGVCCKCAAQHLSLTWQAWACNVPYTDASFPASQTDNRDHDTSARFKAATSTSRTTTSTATADMYHDCSSRQPSSCGAGP
jgi:hypothetical protein